MQPGQTLFLGCVGIALMRLCLPTVQVSQSEDFGSVVGEETMAEEQQVEFSGISGTPGTSRRQILAAQFECYLKIIKTPERTDPGDGAAQLLNASHVIRHKSLVFAARHSIRFFFKVFILSLLPQCYKHVSLSCGQSLLCCLSFK